MVKRLAGNGKVAGSIVCSCDLFTAAAVENKPSRSPVSAVHSTTQCPPPFCMQFYTFICILLAGFFFRETKILHLTVLKGQYLINNNKKKHQWMFAPFVLVVYESQCERMDLKIIQLLMKRV